MRAYMWYFCGLFIILPTTMEVIPTVFTIGQQQATPS
jgi:hypothetical protein